MIELFQMGGMLFMSILTLLFVGVMVAAFRCWFSTDPKKSDLDLIRSLGLLTLIVGILGQLIGLFSAFQLIEQAGSISPAMLAGGLKVSSITTIYGLIIYLIALVLWMVCSKIKS